MTEEAGHDEKFHQLQTILSRGKMGNADIGNGLVFGVPLRYLPNRRLSLHRRNHSVDLVHAPIEQSMTGCSGQEQKLPTTKTRGEGGLSATAGTYLTTTDVAFPCSLQRPLSASQTTHTHAQTHTHTRILAPAKNPDHNRRIRELARCNTKLFLVCFPPLMVYYTWCALSTQHTV